MVVGRGCCGGGSGVVRPGGNAQVGRGVLHTLLLLPYDGLGLLATSTTRRGAGGSPGASGRCQVAAETAACPIDVPAGSGGLSAGARLELEAGDVGS